MQYWLARVPAQRWHKNGPYVGMHVKVCARTCRFMAPETLRSEWQPASDIWAAGAGSWLH